MGLSVIERRGIDGRQFGEIGGGQLPELSVAGDGKLDFRGWQHAPTEGDDEGKAGQCMHESARRIGALFSDIFNKICRKLDASSRDSASGVTSAAAAPVVSGLGE